MTSGGKIPHARSGQGVGILPFVLVWDFFLRISDNLRVMWQTGFEIASRAAAAGRYKFFTF